MTPTADVQDLLVHADWLRRLARQLLRHDGDAGDLVQQTWVAALRSPPARDRPARPWLAVVLRNFARKARRQQRTRDRHEEGSNAAKEVALALGASGQPSAETLLAAAQLQRVLAELVVTLEEPYRTTILLRFYQGIEPTEIAHATGVPAGTVRWRVNEAIRRLRASLDSREGGPDWRRALLPFVGASAPSSLALKGALLIVNTKAKVAVAAAVVATLATGAWIWSARQRQPSSQAGLAGTESLDRSEGALARARASAGQVASARAGIRVPRPGHPPKLIPTPAESTLEATRPPSGSDRGSMDKDQIRRAMRKVIPLVKECYTKLLESQPEASGRLVVRFTITDPGGVGRITEAAIVPKQADGGAPELVSPLTEQCILNAIGNVSFPAPEGGPVVVTYPFNFSPSGGVLPGAPR